MLLKVPQVAELLDVTVARGYQLAREGVLPGVVRIGRQVRIDADTLAAWIANGGTSNDGKHEAPAPIRQ